MKKNPDALKNAERARETDVLESETKEKLEGFKRGEILSDDRKEVIKKTLRSDLENLKEKVGKELTAYEPFLDYKEYMPDIVEKVFSEWKTAVEEGSPALPSVEDFPELFFKKAQEVLPLVYSLALALAKESFVGHIYSFLEAFPEVEKKYQGIKKISDTIAS